MPIKDQLLYEIKKKKWGLLKIQLFLYDNQLFFPSWGAFLYQNQHIYNSAIYEGLFLQ